jgi:L-ascorbate 6-phosphate lactonase
MKTTTQLWEEITTTVVRPQTLAMWWLYQAGIVVKSPAGAVVLIDPYLSDAVTASYGISRQVAAPLDPAEVDADAILASHSHEDHLDPGSIAGFFGHPRTRFLGPPLAVAKVTAAGVDPSRCTAMHRGGHSTVGDLDIRAVCARHIFAPEPVPDAIGYVLEVDGVSIYHSGDTDLDPGIEEDTRGVTVALLPINGTAGNMNVEAAAALAARPAPRVAVPFHYGLWDDDGYGPGATLDPQRFVTLVGQLAPHCQTHVFEPASAVVVGRSGLEF